MDLNARAWRDFVASKVASRSARLAVVAAVCLTSSVGVGWALAGRVKPAQNAGQRAWHGKVAKIVRAGADETRSGLTVGGAPAAEGAEIGAGSVVATDEKTRARLDLDDGTSVVLDRATRLTIDAAPRTMRVDDGQLVADVAHVEGAPVAHLTTAAGNVAVLGTKLALTATIDRTSVEVIRGVVELADGTDKVSVAAGQEGVAQKNAKLEIAPVNDAAQRLAFGERVGLGGPGTHNEDTDLPVSGLGELRARKPGRTDEKDHAVRLASHAVKVRVVGSVARTEIDETFANDTDDVLEGVYRFPLPPNAQMEKLALEVDGKLVDGVFVDRAKGAAIFRGAIHAAAPEAPKPVEEIFWVPGPWHDPALLEWQRGGRFELKIFPIPKHGSRRIVLAYTETVQPVGGVRRYVYPLPQATSSDLRIGSFAVDVQVLGADPTFGVHPRGYELARGASTEANGTRLQQTMTSFVPTGDLTVEYALADRKTDVSAWAYADTSSASSGNYVALALRPKLPGWADARPRDVVLVVDGGRSMFGERFQRARRLAVQLAEEMDRRDRVAVLVCDVACRAMAGPFLAAGPAAAQEVDKFLGGIEPDGASDLVNGVRAAEGLGGRERARDFRAVVVSDGLASAGYRKPARIAAEVKDALSGPRDEIVTVPVGNDADTTTLAEIARGGGGVVVPYAPGEMLEAAALDVLNATCGVTLRDVELKLPDGLADVAPAALAPMRAGGETVVAARLTGDHVQGDVVLKGEVAGEPFEAKYPIDLRPTAAAGNAFVPRLFAAARIADKEREAGEDAKTRTELVKLSQTYAVPSKFTSLLVLESDAMMDAFGIQRGPKVASWTGESQAQGVDVTTLARDEEEAAGEGSGADALGLLGKSAESKTSPLGPFGTTPRAAAKPVSPGDSLGGDLGGLGSIGGGASNGAGDGFGLSGAGKGGGGHGRRGASAGDPSSPAPSATFAPPPPPAPAEERADVTADKKEANAPVTAPPPPPRPARHAHPSLDASNPWTERDRAAGGRFMKRVFVRRASIAGSAPPVVGVDRLAAARAAVAAAPDERAKYRDLVRLLTASASPAGDAELGEVLARWSSRDPLDVDVVAARSDLASRAGDRDAALRILGGVAAASGVPTADVAALEALAAAHERDGDGSGACSFRFTAAELRPTDADRVGRAVACERAAGRTASAARWLDGVKIDRAAVDAVAARHEPLAKSASAPLEAASTGDVVVDATWDASANEDYDIAIVDPSGNRLSWVSRSRNVRVSDALSRRHESLAVTSRAVGPFTIELVRAAGAGSAPVPVTVTVRSLGESTTVTTAPLTQVTTPVARVNVRLEQQLVPLDGTESSFAQAPFDRPAAAVALGRVTLLGCSVDGVAGAGHSSITFAPSGRVASVALEPPFAGTSTGACVAQAYRRVAIPAFAGGAVTIGKSFVVPP